jgi:phage shock protein E
MINTLKKIFGLGPKVDYKELIKNGAQIIDVRTSGEYASGHIKGSLNIPLNSISANVKKIKKDTPLITCCASGMRSASAKATLKAIGYKDVYNGGGWMSLNLKLHK